MVLRAINSLTGDKKIRITNFAAIIHNQRPLPYFELEDYFSLNAKLTIPVRRTKVNMIISRM